MLMLVILVARQGDAFHGHDCAATQRPVWTRFSYEVRRGDASSRVLMNCLMRTTLRFISSECALIMQSGLSSPLSAPCLCSYDPIHTVGSLLAAVLFVYMGLEVRPLEIIMHGHLFKWGSVGKRWLFAFVSWAWTGPSHNTSRRVESSLVEHPL